MHPGWVAPQGAGPLHKQDNPIYLRPAHLNGIGHSKRLGEKR